MGLKPLLPNGTSIFEHVELDRRKICPPAAFVFGTSAFWRAALVKAIDRSLFSRAVGQAACCSVPARARRRALLERRSPKAQNSHGLTGRCLYWGSQSTERCSKSVWHDLSRPDWKDDMGSWTLPNTTLRTGWRKHPIPPKRRALFQVKIRQDSHTPLRFSSLL